MPSPPPRRSSSVHPAARRRSSAVEGLQIVHNRGRHARTTSRRDDHLLRAGNDNVARRVQARNRGTAPVVGDKKTLWRIIRANLSQQLTVRAPHRSNEPAVEGGRIDRP